MSSNYYGIMEKSPVVLTLTIDNSQPIALSSFVKAFTSLAQEYQSSLRDNDDFLEAESEVFIKQIRSGSIIADLIPVAASTLPLVAAESEKIFAAIDFVKKWESRFKELLSGVIPKNASRTDLKRWADATENIARDPNASSTLEVATFKDGKRQVEASFTFRTSEARQIEKVIDGEFKRLDEKNDSDFQRVLMIFTRSDVGDAPLGRKSGERVFIQDISDKSLAITYGSELAEQRIKHEIRESDENIYKKGFNVDVKVQTKGTRPVAYSIMHVHDVIELPE